MEEGGSDVNAEVEMSDETVELGTESLDGEVAGMVSAEEPSALDTTSDAGAMDTSAAETFAQESAVETTTAEPTASESSAAAPEKKYLDMTLKEWELVPSSITVNTGDTVVLTLTSPDVDHGLSIPQFGVSQFVGAGETVTVTFVADKAGSYTMFCNVQCGQGHGRMKGTLVVL